jgi:hypothetical protein
VFNGFKHHFELVRNGRRGLEILASYGLRLAHESFDLAALHLMRRNARNVSLGDWVVQPRRSANGMHRIGWQTGAF